MVGCRKPLYGVASAWVHRGKIESNYGWSFWNMDFRHSTTNKPIACGDPNHSESNTCCQPEENPILCDSCLRKLGYIW